MEEQKDQTSPRWRPVRLDRRVSPVSVWSDTGRVAHTGRRAGREVSKHMRLMLRGVDD